ncbi:ORF400 [White spot syndrome virus]|uniref:ORF400 n=1 Tax=White spot syndrome virus TaxID=342409 RepID=A0A2D3I5J1_9VIRU|nr:ORF400 [White spot syndrome virus]
MQVKNIQERNPFSCLLDCLSFFCVIFGSTQRLFPLRIATLKCPSTQCPRALAMTFIGTIWPSEAWLIITTVVSPLFQSRLFPIGTIAVVEILQPVIRM